jgi:hypothetical protein
MLRWYEMEMEMRTRSLLREACLTRLILEARTAQRVAPSVGDRVLSLMGGQLIRWGRRLQARHDLGGVSQGA